MAWLKIDLFLKMLGSDKASRHNLLLDWSTASAKSVFYPFKKLPGSSEIASAAINRLLCLCFDSDFLRLTHMGRTSSPSIFRWCVIGRNKTWNKAACDQSGYYLKVNTCSAFCQTTRGSTFAPSCLNKLFLGKDWRTDITVRYNLSQSCWIIIGSFVFVLLPETNNKFFLIQPSVTCSAQSAHSAQRTQHPHGATLPPQRPDAANYRQTAAAWGHPLPRTDRSFQTLPDRNRTSLLHVWVGGCHVPYVSSPSEER